MNKDSQGRSSLWVLLISCTALFVILVIVKNLQFWNMRKTGIDLVEIVSKSHRRRQIFSSGYYKNVREQNDILACIGSPNEKNRALENLPAAIAVDDSGFASADPLLYNEKERHLFRALQETDNAKKQQIRQFLQEIASGGPGQDRLLSFYNQKLFPLYLQYERTDNQLLKAVDYDDHLLIAGTEQQITIASTINFWISSILILDMVFLGILLVKIRKIDRRTHFELRESERKYRELTEQTNEMIIKCDANGNFVFANDRFKKTFEYDDDELRSVSLAAISGDSDQLRFRFPLRGEEVITHMEKLVTTKSGKSVYLEGNIVAEYTNGTFSGTLGFFNDVTEKKRLEESLVSSELKFRTFFNVAPIPMWALDPETRRFVLVNRAAVNHYGYEETEFLNKTVMDLRREVDPKVIEADMLRMRKKCGNGRPDKTYRFNVNHFKRSGEKIEVELYSAPILLDGKNCILTIAIDVTERNQMENKITKAIIKTQEDERFEIGSELHDNVCQILAAAGINLSRLKPSLAGSDLTLYQQSSDGIRMAAEEIRNLSHRLAPAFFDNTTLEEAFEGLLNSFNFRQSHEVFLYFDNRVKTLPLGQEMQLNLYRILQEQLRNIIKYAVCSAIEIGVFIKNNKLKMRIADNGRGFDLDAAKGGIGLANMKRRAELFGGEMTLYAAPGKGSELIITIPVLTSEKASAE